LHFSRIRAFTTIALVFAAAGNAPRVRADDREALAATPKSNAPTSRAAVADAPDPSAITLEQLTRMSRVKLEAAYRTAHAGAIPRGFARGRVLYGSDDAFKNVRSGVSRFLWRGKHFDDVDGTLINQWFAVRAIRATVDYGPSWLDGAPAVVMDYAATSHIWSDVRDEIREVAPGLYLGRMYRRTTCGERFKLFFALQSCPDRCSNACP
jgi:hypothetical protein